MPSFGAMPKNQVMADFDPSRFNRLDGWSPGSQIMANPGVRVDGTKLVGERDDWTRTTAADSATQILEFETGVRVPHFAEVDANANAPGREDDPQIVLLHPMVRLKPATRYVVALRNSVVLGFTVTALCVVVAVPMAWAVSRTDMPGKTLVKMLTLGAFITPPATPSATAS